MKAVFQWLTLVTAVTVLLFTNCSRDKDGETEIHPIDGAFSGTFTFEGNTLSLILYIEDSTFEAILYNSKLPEICHGTFSRNAQSLHFNNSCTRKSGLNWKLILSGNFEYTYDGKSLVFWNNNLSFNLNRQKEKIFYSE